MPRNLGRQLCGVQAVQCTNAAPQQHQPLSVKRIVWPGRVRANLLNLDSQTFAARLNLKFLSTFPTLHNPRSQNRVQVGQLGYVVRVVLLKRKRFNLLV